MAITTKEVKKVAKLSRLSFTEEEYNNFANQLSNIMNMIDQILEVDCENIEPLTSVNDANLRLRDDKPEGIPTLEDLFVNAPGKDAELSREIKCFIVPKVVE